MLFTSLVNTNMKNTWRGIKQIITTKSKKCQTSNNIVINNKSLTNSKDIANPFNDYFAAICSNLTSTIPPASKSLTEYLTEPQSTRFFINPTTPKEIEEEINKLNSNKASGPCKITTKLLKILKNILSYPLSNLCNLSFSEGTVPDLMKIARVIPVYKSGSHTDMSNYRPISLLSIFHKILEKLMHKRLMNLLKLEQYP